MESRPYVTHKHASAKAGLEGADRETINRIIEEASANSEYGKKQKRKREDTEVKVQAMRQTILANQSLGPAHYEKSNRAVQMQIQHYEKKRDLTQTWIYIDMDMFYASVETLDDPSLADIPMAVGGESMLCTANYNARKFGISAGMPGYIARKLCPDVTIIPCNFSKYKAVGKVVRDIFREYDEGFESLGLDEGSLLVTEHLRARDMDNDEGRQALASEIRGKIFDQTRLTASAGIACNKRLAKICSDQNKPNGQFYLRPNRDEILQFMQGLRIRKAPGVGPVLEQTLVGVGVNIVGDILQLIVQLSWVFSDINFKFLLKTALGIGRVHHSVSEPQKSVSISRSFIATEDLSFLLEKLQKFSQKLEEELAGISASGQTVSVFLKDYMFNSWSKNRKLKCPVEKAADLYNIGVDLLKCANMDKPIRLIGLRVSELDYNKPKNQLITKFFSTNPVNSQSSEQGIQLVKRKCRHCEQIMTRSAKAFEVHENSCLEEERPKKNSRGKRGNKRRKDNKGQSILSFYKGRSEG